jgi:hypothetical protein
MPRHTLEPVHLKHSYPIKKRQFKGTVKELEQRQEQELYGAKSRSSKVIDGKVLEKTIHSYRMWFLFLKLALELEDQGTVLIMKNSAKKKGYELPTQQIKYKIKVNKKKYEEWDLDQVRTLPFNKWFFDSEDKKGHRHLFTDEVTKVLTPADSISNDPDKITIEIDKRRRFTDIVSDLRQMNNEQEIFKRQSRDKFPITGRVRPLTLLNKYNCLVLKLEDELSNEEILIHKDQYIRPTDSRTKDGYATQKDPSKIRIVSENQLNYGITIFDLISGTKKSFGAKQILLSVCDGYFLKHPTKSYLD